MEWPDVLKRGKADFLFCLSPRCCWGAHNKTTLANKNKQSMGRLWQRGATWWSLYKTAKAGKTRGEQVSRLGT
eukprot:3979128-Prorocentrum_lima.AAC.1